MSYTFNGNASDVIDNPTVAHPVVLLFTANKNVNWVSIKIEKENNDSGVDIHKYYYPGNDCDGKNICTQDWDGKLIGELLQNNTAYKVKVRIRDLNDSEKNYDFISPYKIIVEM